MPSTKNLLTLIAAFLPFAASAQSRPQAALPAAAQTPTVFLNHFFVVLDSASYAAMQSDSFMTTGFAPFEKRTTVRNDSTYTAAYWYGRQTYFEVFEPPSQGPQGSSGIAFSVDGEGESKAISDAWKVSLGDVQAGPVTRKTETAEPAWFQMTSGKAGEGTAAPGVRLWLMEYDKDFLARWYPDLSAARGKTRGPVLDRYVAKIGKSKERGTSVFGNVKELLLALDSADRALLVKHLLPVGWTRKDYEFIMVLRGPEGVTIKVMPIEDKRRGIIEAVFAVQGTPTPRTAKLGNVGLSVTEKEARLRFVP